MRVAYVFSTGTASYILERMILPQLEGGTHGATVVGMFFFVDNNYLLTQDNPTAARLAAVAQRSRMLVMGCDQCCEARRIEDRIHSGFAIGCFPQLYAALGQAGGVDQVITL